MCKSVFVHDWRTQGIRVAEGAAMIRHNARYFSLFSPIREKSGLDAVAGCASIYLHSFLDGARAMAKRPADAKTRSLKEHGCLNPHAETVRDELFLSNAFFDPRDLVQVRYEMLRRVREDGMPVSHAAASFGVSRPTWYQAQRAYEADGLPGLLPDRPGPRRPHKLSDEVVEALQAAKSEQPELTAADLVELVRTRFGISVHRRSIDRALARGKKR